jgi:hypothetical protein
MKEGNMEASAEQSGAARALSMVLKFPDLHHLSTAKVTRSMLCNPAFLSSGQFSKRLANQFPIIKRDIARRHIASLLPVSFGSRFHNGIMKWLFCPHV